MIFRSAFTIAVVALLPNFAFAEPGLLRGACGEDMKALCGSVQPGGGRLRDCMREHRAQLSNACKVAIADRMLERSASKAPAQFLNINARKTEHAGVRFTSKSGHVQCKPACPLSANSGQTGLQ